MVTHRIEEQADEHLPKLEGSESSGRSVNYNAIRNATESELRDAIKVAKQGWSKDEASGHAFDRFLLSLDKKRKNKSPTKMSTKHPKVRPDQVPASKPSSSGSQSKKKNSKPKRAKIASSSEDE